MAASRLGALALTLACVPVLAQDGSGLPCREEDRACVYRVAKAHPAVKIDTWQSALALPAQERVGPASRQLVEYLNLDNVLSRIPERPRAAALTADLLADVRGAIADLPASIWKRVGNRFVGLYFVDGLGGTGYTDYVNDENGVAVAAFIVLDARVLSTKTANAWATWKENTPFSADARYSLTARIATDADDNRKNAIAYILLHELGHVMSVGANVHPPWNIRPKQVTGDANYPFFDLTWTIDRSANKFRSRFDPAFRQRERVTYYFGAKLAAADMLPTYANLKRTNFPSLYAATTPGDDFAEAFASYVHVVVMQRPWEIRILRDGQLVEVFKPCWTEARCAKKRDLLERLLNGQS